MFPAEQPLEEQALRRPWRRPFWERSLTKRRVCSRAGGDDLDGWLGTGGGLRSGGSTRVSRGRAIWRGSSVPGEASTRSGARSSPVCPVRRVRGWRWLYLYSDEGWRSSRRELRGAPGPHECCVGGRGCSPVRGSWREAGDRGRSSPRRIGLLRAAENVEHCAAFWRNSSLERGAPRLLRSSEGDGLGVAPFHHEGARRDRGGDAEEAAAKIAWREGGHCTGGLCPVRAEAES